MPTRLPTGIGVLDRRLGGGLPPGSIVALSAPPASQAELLLDTFTAPRETLYLTLDRPAAAVADGLRRAAVETGDPDISAILADEPVECAIDSLDELGERATLVVDPHDRLEREGRTRLSMFTTRLRERVDETGSLAVLHCLDTESRPAARATTEHVADVVFRLTTTTAGASVETRLAVPKVRGGRALAETLKLDLTDRVAVDTSRDIA